MCCAVLSSNKFTLDQMKFKSRILSTCAAALLIPSAAGATPLEGDWIGQLNCSVSFQNPAKAPAFSNLIRMSVAGNNAKVTRDTNAVIEVLTGTVTKAGRASLFGSGQYKDPSRAATWTTKIEGIFSGNQFSASGEIINQNGQKGRDCTIEMTKAEAAPQNVAQKKDVVGVHQTAKESLLTQKVESNNIAADLVQAAKTAVATYQESGMTGLVGKTKECYQKLSGKQFKCVYLDLASRRIDQIATVGTNFPPNIFFANEQFGSRIRPALLGRANMSQEQANEYLRTSTPIINQLVEKQLGQGKQGSQEKCVKRKMAAWEKQRDKEMRKWCADLAKKGEECRISAGQDALAKEEALGKNTAQCQ